VLVSKEVAPERDGRYHDGPVVVRWVRRESAYERFLKPAIDRAAGIVLLLLVLPTLVILALVVRVVHGPRVIFTQRRIGRWGRVFTVYKFRTMQPDRRLRRVRPDGIDRRLTHKHPDDPRHTRLGRFLRKWSLDELPQLWNVVRGDMSLVGPRPELVEVVEKYDDWQHGRHSVKPGLTGLWQVEARNDGTPMHENTHLDLAYVRQVGFLTDCRILLLTIPALLGRRTGI
jgi:lipopolysaccharide/colanic/teichoic acid biosynthesis glycosyltransferase